MRGIRRRPGVAAVLGMLFMVLVFMAAIGAQAYISGLQEQTAQSAAQSQQVSGQRADEQVTYGGPSSGLTATDTGPSEEVVVGMLLKFENGTVVQMDADSTSAFREVSIPVGDVVQVESLVPAGRCSPGTASCLSKYNAVTSGAPVKGRAVGLVTSLGNVFWYVPSAAAPSQGASQVYHTSTSQSTNSPTFVGVPGLSFAGSSNSFYEVQVFVPYTQSSSTQPSPLAFAVSVPAGATFVFCGGLWFANPAAGTTDLPEGNQCNTAPNFTLGATSNSVTFCVQTTNMCEFVGTAFVSFGATSGPFSFEFEGSASDRITVMAGASLVVTQAG